MSISAISSSSIPVQQAKPAAPAPAPVDADGDHDGDTVASVQAKALVAPGVGQSVDKTA